MQVYLYIYLHINMHTSIHGGVEVNTLLLIVIVLVAWFTLLIHHILLFKLQTGLFRVGFFLSEHQNQAVGVNGNTA